MPDSLLPSHDLSSVTRKLEIDSLRLLAVVCQEGSYARAALHEPLTASAISKRIAELERAMGCVLLDRSNSGVRPTAAGEVVLNKWGEVASALASLLASSDGLASPQGARLSVVCDADAARFLTFDCLSAVEALDDADKVSVTRAALNWLPVEFEKMSAHIAMWCLQGSARDVQDVQRAQVLLERFAGCAVYGFAAEVCVALVRQDHPLAGLGLLSVDDLYGHEVVCAGGAGSYVAPRLSDIGAQHGGSVQIRRPAWSHQASSVLEYLDTVPTGVIAFAPTSVRYVMHRYAGVRCLTLTEDLGCLDFACAVRDDGWAAERVRLLERLTGSQFNPITHRTGAPGLRIGAHFSGEKIGTSSGEWRVSKPSRPAYTNHV